MEGGTPTRFGVTLTQFTNLFLVCLYEARNTGNHKLALLARVHSTEFGDGRMLVIIEKNQF